jgi:hypothetical protein
MGFRNLAFNAIHSQINSPARVFHFRSPFGLQLIQDHPSTLVRSVNKRIGELLFEAGDAYTNCIAANAKDSGHLIGRQPIQVHHQY